MITVGFKCFFCFVLFRTPYPYFEPCKPPLIEVLSKGVSLHPELELSFSYLEEKKKKKRQEIVIFYKAAAISKAYYLSWLKAQRNDSSVLTFKIQNFSLF